MSLPLPNLDDLTYKQLVDEAHEIIAGLAPEWQGRNPSDPGVMLVELFAWLTDMMMYRVNRIPEASLDVFLKLLNGPRWRREGTMDEAIGVTMRSLREQHRAVTSADYESLCAHLWPTTPAGQEQLGRLGATALRVHCIPNVDLSGKTEDQRIAEKPDHVSVVVLPVAAATPTDGLRPAPDETMLRSLWHFLDERRLLTTRHHVVGPVYVPVEVRLSLRLHDDALPEDVRVRTKTALTRFCDPLVGGQEGKGWPFGRDLIVSEIVHVLKAVSGIDVVDDVRLITPDAGRLKYTHGRLHAVDLRLHELIALTVDETHFALLT